MFSVLSVLTVCFVSESTQWRRSVLGRARILQCILPLDLRKLLVLLWVAIADAYVLVRGSDGRKCYWELRATSPNGICPRLPPETCPQPHAGYIAGLNASFAASEHSPSRVSSLWPVTSNSSHSTMFRYIHIPKCAGASFITQLKGFLPEQIVYPPLPDGIEHCYGFDLRLRAYEENQSHCLTGYATMAAHACMVYVQTCTLGE